MSNKTELRQTLIETRRALEPAIRAQWDAAIATQVLAWCERNPVQTLGIYWPVLAEPELQGLYSELGARGVTLALPVVVDRCAPLEFSIWKPGDPLMKEAHGVMVPAERGAFIKPESLLVPCVGFNPGRYRLGYGAGYYDRTLAVMPDSFTIGIAYSCALAMFEAASHDIALDVIITEQPSDPVTG